MEKRGQGRLAGKVAIVTGAGSGFGEGIARRFAEEGAAVVVNDIVETAARRVAREIGEAGGKASAVVADVSRDADVKRLVDSALKDHGRLDIVVNNAGTTHRNRPMLEVGEDEFDRIYAVNVKSLYLTARHAVPHFRSAGGGCFVTIASTAGVRPRPGLTWYNGSKGAAIVTSRSMAAELGPDNIRVNVVNPVIGETGLLEMFMGVPDTPENRQRFIATIPMGRLSRPLDVANAALFLASDDAAFVNGVCLEVDGGRCV
jgi:3-oxoacyl-[acyl-carrier protein] reductase